MAHKYNLIIRHDFGKGPIYSSEQEKVLNKFHDSFHSLEIINEEKKRVTLHITSDSALEKKTVIASLPGFNVTDFYEVE